MQRSIGGATTTLSADAKTPDYWDNHTRRSGLAAVPGQAYRPNVSILITWALYTAALALVAAVIPGFQIKGGLKGTLAVAALFGILNWALAWLLTALIGLFTLGLGWIFSTITQTIVVAIVLSVTDGLTDRLKIKSFWIALLAAAIVSFTVAFLRRFV